MIDKPGYYNIPMHEYLSDPCPEPSLSTRVVCDLWNETALHAQMRHPRLGATKGDNGTRADIGSAVHSLLADGPAVLYAPSGFDDWRKKDAQAFRDATYEEGSIPLLERQREDVESATEAARKLLSELGSGQHETTMIFRIGDAWARSRADWLSDDGLYDIDFKTAESASQMQWARYGVADNEIQCGLRSIGHRELTGKARRHRWMLIEYKRPWACSFVDMTGQKLNLAERKCLWAARKWRACLDAKVWPGYDSKPYTVDVKPWEEDEYAQRTGEAP